MSYRYSIYKRAESIGESTKGTTTLSNKLNFNFDIEVICEYIIKWNYELTNATENKGVDCQILLNDNEIARNTDYVTATNMYASYSGHKASSLNKGVNNVTIKFRTLSAGNNAKIKNTSVVIERL